MTNVSFDSVFSQILRIGLLIIGSFFLPACSETNFQSSNNKKVSDNSAKEDTKADNSDLDVESVKKTKKESEKSDDNDDSDVDFDDDADLVVQKDEFPSGDDVEIDEQTKSTTLGQEVDVIGVHFEDGGDNDFNDLSVCLKGKFKINGTNVVSLGKQTVTLTAKRISGIAHTYSIKITKESGEQIDTFSGTPDAAVEVKHTSKIFPGSRLFVETTTAKGTHLDMNTAKRARVELNICRNTGS